MKKSLRLLPLALVAFEEANAQMVQRYKPVQGSVKEILEQDGKYEEAQRRRFEARRKKETSRLLIARDTVPPSGPDPLAGDDAELSQPGEYFAPIEYPHVQSAISFDDINLYGMSELQKSFLQTFYDEYTSLLKQRSDLLVLRLELERRLAHNQDLLALKKEASGKQEEIMAALDPDSDDMTELDATKKSEIKREIKEIERVIETINVIVGEEQPEDGSDKEAYLEAAERTGLFARIGNFFEQLFGDTNRFGPGGYSLEREEALADRFEQHASTLKKPTTQERVQQAGKEIGIEIGGK